MEITLATGDVLGIGSHPSRKNPFLYYAKEGQVFPLAYFSDDERVRLATVMLKAVAQSRWDGVDYDTPKSEDLQEG